MQAEQLRVLLVEDDEDDYVLTRDLLAELDYYKICLEWTRDYDRGIEAICGGDFDVCLVDYRLGPRTGLELIAEAIQRECSLPMILLTGQGDRGVDLAAMRAGASDYLVKSGLHAGALDRAIRYSLQRKRTEENLRLRQLTEALEEADRRKDDFLALLAHELRNPIAAICNAGTLLAHPGLTEDARGRALGSLTRQTDHLTRLVDDLLDVSRIARGKGEIERLPVDLDLVLRNTVEDFRPALSAAGLNLSLEPAPGPVWVEGDAVRLTQVVGNLLANALKFTPAGGQVTVRPELIPDSREVRVTVRDTGAGIPPALLPDVFTPFVQGEHSSARTSGGLGLGLALVQGFIHLHGGQVAVASNPGAGAEFSFTLPLASAPSVSGEATPTSAAPLSARWILLVEDNPDVGETMRDLLELKGHQVMLVQSGEAALELAARRRPDVVLCDLGLPGMDGLCVARSLRESSGANVTLVALSGYGRDEDVRQCREAGFDHHLVKPVDLEALDSLLAELGAAESRRGE